MINVFVRVYFDVFRQSSLCNFRLLKQSSFFVFGVFVDIDGFRQSSRCNFCPEIRIYIGSLLFFI